MLQRLFGRRFFNWSMKKTLYGQFVAGEDLDSLDPVIERYRRSGVRSILDYAVEEDIGDKQEELKNKLRYRSGGGKGGEEGREEGEDGGEEGEEGREEGEEGGEEVFCR